MRRPPVKRESEVEAAIGRYATAKGCIWWKLVSPSMRGVPDRLIVTPYGVTGWLELKAKGKKPEPLQKVRQGELAERRAPVHWVDNVEDGKAFIDDLLKHRQFTIKPAPVDEFSNLPGADVLA